METAPPVNRLPIYWKNIVRMKLRIMTERNEKAIHILMVGSSPSVKGGMSNVVTQLLEHKWGQNIKVRYVATHVSGPAVRRCLVFFRGYFTILYMLLFHREQVDIVHMHMSYKGSFYRKYMLHFLVKKFGKKDIIHLHGSEFKAFYDTGGTRQRQKIRRLLGECDRMLVLGDYWEQSVLEIAPRARTFILRNAIPIPDRQARWDDEKVQLLYLGVLIQRKGIHDLLHAISILQKNGVAQQRALKLVVAGTGEQEHELKQLCTSLGLDEIVTFTGWIEGVQKKTLLESSQCLILPSYYEGLPLAVLEAISYGLPVITTNVGSVSDAILDGENGFLVPTGSPQRLAEAIEQVTADTTAWERMSKRARQIALERFNEQAFFARLQDLYCAMIHEED